MVDRTERTIKKWRTEKRGDRCPVRQISGGGRANVLRSSSSQADTSEQCCLWMTSGISRRLQLVSSAPSVVIRSSIASDYLVVGDRGWRRRAVPLQRSQEYRCIVVHRRIGRYRRSKQEITDIPNHGTSSTLYKFLVMNGPFLRRRNYGFRATVRTVSMVSAELWMQLVLPVELVLAAAAYRSLVLRTSLISCVLNADNCR